MIDKPIVYRPKTHVLGWWLMVAFLAAPVAVLVFAKAPIAALVLALALCPFGIAIFLALSSSKMTLTDEGVHLRTSSEDVMLPWADIRRFDCLATVVIYMRNGDIHPVSWLETAPVQRFMGTLGHGDYLAQELNAMLMEQTGRVGPDGDADQVRPKVMAERPEGRARLAKATYGTFAASVLTIAAYFATRVWWALPLILGVVGLAWLAVRQRRKDAQH